MMGGESEWQWLQNAGTFCHIEQVSSFKLWCRASNLWECLCNPGKFSNGLALVSSEHHLFSIQALTEMCTNWFQHLPLPGSALRFSFSEHCWLNHRLWMLYWSNGECEMPTLLQSNQAWNVFILWGDTFMKCNCCCRAIGQKSCLNWSWLARGCPG